MKLAFIFIAEAYQLYHAAAVLFELMDREDVTVDVFHIDPAVPHHLEKLRKVHNASPVRSEHLEAGLLGKAIQATRLLGLAKPQVLAKNEARFASYDAVISTEDGIVFLFKGIPEHQRPQRILITHGVAQRSFPSIKSWVDCDLILANSAADIAAYGNAGCQHLDRLVSAGYPKFVSTRLLSSATKSFFDNPNPVVMYNPHKEPKERSWDRFFEPLMDGFANDPSMNLIVAPHVKLFRRRSERLRSKLRARSTANVIVDPGSEQSLDNTYSEAADIYVGDVSSQVFEFIYRPRPCVFLNAHNVDWQDNPQYAFWHLGEVVSDPAEVMAAIKRAPERHHEFKDRQAATAASSLGDPSEASVIRSADLIQNFVRTRQRPQ